MKKFEFLLKINGNIICQRYFAVRNFNPKSAQSLDMLYCVSDCVSMIQERMVEKSVDYIWNQFNPYDTQTLEQINRTPIFEKEDIFDFEIRIDERVIAAKRFTGNVLIFETLFLILFIQYRKRYRKNIFLWKTKEQNFLEYLLKTIKK